MTNTYTTDSTLNPDAFRFEPGTFSPDPRRAPVSKMLASQAKIEATLFLRHGEQLLLSFIIPLGMLIVIAILPVINDPHPLHKGFPLMLSIAAMSSGFTGQAISLAFDRRYGALKRTGASGVPTWTIIVGKILGVVTVSILQILVLGTTALRLLSSTRCPVLVVKQPPHEPYRRLLVPVDFSASSLRAVRHARRIAPRADIVLLHAFDVPFEGKLRYASVDDEVIHHYRIVAREEALQKLQALRDQAGLPVVGTRLLVLHGDPTYRIIEQEQECDCDLVVMGKHGEGMLEELFLGSVTKHVLAESQGDVLVSV